MMSQIPIGTVLPFAGQLEPSAVGANSRWSNMPCAGGESVPAEQSPDAPVLRIESDGWMPCDGRYLSIAAYPELHAVLGTMYGSKTSDSQPEFAIPDYRGLFLRGADAGSGMDPDAAARTTPTGDHVGNVVGSLQCDTLQTHTHQYNITQPAGTAPEGTAASVATTSTATGEPDTPARVSTETRPKNVAVNYIIRFR